MNRRSALKLLALVPFAGSALVRALAEPQPEVADDLELMDFSTVKSGGEPIRRGRLFIVVGRSQVQLQELAAELSTRYGLKVIDQAGVLTPWSGIPWWERYMDNAALGDDTLLVVKASREAVYVDPILDVAYVRAGYVYNEFYYTTSHADWVFVLEGWRREEDTGTGAVKRWWSCRTLKDRSGEHSPAWMWNTEWWCDGHLKAGVCSKS